MGADLRGLGHRTPLGFVNARVAAERIGHETCDGEIDKVVGTEQLNPHDGAGQGRVGGRSEHGQKSEGGEQGRNHGIEFDPAHCQNLQGKNGASQRLRL